jgi:transcriptional regulator with XRE-family HTH domain
MTMPVNQNIVSFEFRKLLARRHRVSPKITLKQIAEAAKLSVGTVHQIEIGRIKRPGYDTVTKIQSALEALLAERQSAAKGETPIAHPSQPTT